MNELFYTESFIECLCRIPFFEELDAEQLRTVVEYTEFISYEKDVVLFEEGDKGDYVCFIIDGELDVIKHTSDGDSAVIATLSGGSSIGEMAVIDDHPRSATVKTCTPCSLLVLKRDKFEQILDNYPKIGVIMLKGISRMLSLHLRKSSSVIVLNKQKNELIGIAAHDLKNPLSAIMGFSSFIIDAREKISSEKVIGYLNMILKSSEKMLTIITNLLDVNRIESEGITLEPEYFRLTILAETIVKNYREIAKKKNINIQFFPSEKDQIIADQRLTERVLDNLISNAVKYSPLGKQVFVRIISVDDTVRCEIQDEGPGISDEDQKKLFIKFSCLSATPTGGEHSTGLGLWIVKKLMEAMEGKVWCESILGNGATFIIEFKIRSENDNSFRTDTKA